MVTGEVAQSLVSNENEQICLEWRRWIGFHQCDSVTVCNPGKKTPAGFPIDFSNFILKTSDPFSLQSKCGWTNRCRMRRRRAGFSRDAQMLRT